jgi:hypothetical protein
VLPWCARTNSPGLAALMSTGSPGTRRLLPAGSCGATTAIFTPDADSCSKYRVGLCCTCSIQHRHCLREIASKVAEPTTRLSRPIAYFFSWVLLKGTKTRKPNSLGDQVGEGVSIKPLWCILVERLQAQIGTQLHCARAMPLPVAGGQCGTVPLYHCTGTGSPLPVSLPVALHCHSSVTDQSLTASGSAGSAT